MSQQSTIADRIGVTTRLQQTPGFTDDLMVLEAAMKKNGIAALEGDPGTGKTTTARYFAEKTNRPCAIATMPFRPAPLDLLRLVHHAVHDSRPHPRVNRYDLTQDLVEHLRVWQGVLVVDELQNTGANAMQDLVYLYEEAEHAFALVLVGSTVLTAVNAHPQLATRIMGSTTFLPLAGDELLQTVRDMDARLARTPDKVLLEHDARACKGIPLCVRLR